MFSMTAGKFSLIPLQLSDSHLCLVLHVIFTQPLAFVLNCKPTENLKEHYKINTLLCFYTSILFFG